MRATTNPKICKVLLITLIAVLMTSLDEGALPLLVQAKRGKCINRLKSGDQDFFYCSKFAVAKYTKLMAWYSAQFTRSQAQYAANKDTGRDIAKITVAIYNHQQWQRVLKVEGDDKQACQEKQKIANDQRQVEVPLNGTLVENWLSKTTQHKAGPQMYYVAVMDCDEELNFLIGGQYGKIEVKTHITDDYEQEFSYEKKGIIQINVFLLIVYIVIFALNYSDWSNFQRRHDLWNTPHIYCIGAMIFQLISIIVELQANILFSGNGEDYVVLDVFTSIFAMINECTMILLLMMIANGWMTLWTKYSLDDGMEIYAPLFMLVLCVHICFAALAFVDRDQYHKYHDFQGWAGFGLIMAKFVLVGIFFYFYVQTKPQVAKSSLPFYEQIIQIGLVYLLSDPILLLGTYILSEWNMAFYYNIADQLVHLILQIYFLYQMSDTKSRFTKSVDNFSTLPTDLKKK